MELLKGDDGWYWKYHAPNPDPDPVGPYDTREEAVTDLWIAVWLWMDSSLASRMPVATTMRMTKTKISLFCDF